MCQCLRIRTHVTDYLSAKNNTKDSFFPIRCQHSKGFFLRPGDKRPFPQGLLTFSPTFHLRLFPCQFEFILSETNKESCPFIINIVIDYSLVETVKSVTRNIAVKEEDPKKHEKSQRSHFRTKRIMGFQME